MSWLPRMIATGSSASVAIDHGARVGAVADEIAEARAPRRSPIARGVGEHGVERLQVGVDVAQDEVAHAAQRRTWPFEERRQLVNRFEDAVDDGGRRTRATRSRARAPAGTRRRARAYSRSSSARSAASGRRPSSGMRGMRSASGTSIQTDTPSRLIARAIVGIGERAAAGRDDDVTHRLEEPEDLALDRAEVRLAVLARRCRRSSAARAARSDRRCLRHCQRRRAASARAIVLLPLAMNPTR